MKAYLVEVNWALLFWSGLLLINAVAVTVQVILDSKTRKAIVQQNQLIMEQNRSLKTLIIRVCSKSVRERKEQEENGMEKTESE